MYSDWKQNALWGESSKSPSDAQVEMAEAMERAEKHANQEWMDHAARVIWDYAVTGEPFTTDEVMTKMEKSPYTTHEPRALGPVINRALRKKVIKHTGDYAKSTRRHSSPIPVYVGVVDQYAVHR